ncbi:hypothetical protein C8R45DRAFT_1077773 [Mycena sanguinolenta]|nr:hypothetical protein C8R45DRAFT_1077773 [Mycena sanguinolenta]
MKHEAARDEGSDVGDWGAKPSCPQRTTLERGASPPPPPAPTPPTIREGVAVASCLSSAYPRQRRNEPQTSDKKTTRGHGAAASHRELQQDALRESMDGLVAKNDAKDGVGNWLGEETVYSTARKGDNVGFTRSALSKFVSKGAFSRASTRHESSGTRSPSQRRSEALRDGQMKTVTSMADCGRGEVVGRAREGFGYAENLSSGSRKQTAATARTEEGSDRAGTEGRMPKLDSCERDRDAIESEVGSAWWRQMRMRAGAGDAAIDAGSVREEQAGPHAQQRPVPRIASGSRRHEIQAPEATVVQGCKRDTSGLHRQSGKRKHAWWRVIGRGLGGYAERPRGKTTACCTASPETVQSMAMLLVECGDVRRRDTDGRGAVRLARNKDSERDVRRIRRRAISPCQRDGTTAKSSFSYGFKLQHEQSTHRLSCIRVPFVVDYRLAIVKLGLEPRREDGAASLAGRQVDKVLVDLQELGRKPRRLKRKSKHWRLDR